MDTFEIPIIKKSYEFYRELYIVVKQFPKGDRYALGEKCDLAALELLASLFEAGSVTKTEKRPLLARASVQLNLIRVYLRLAKDIKIVDMKRYLALQTDLEEMGRMLGGWKRYAG